MHLRKRGFFAAINQIDTGQRKAGILTARIRPTFWENKSYKYIWNDAYSDFAKLSHQQVHVHKSCIADHSKVQDLTF